MGNFSFRFHNHFETPWYIFIKFSYFFDRNSCPFYLLWINNWLIVLITESFDIIDGLWFDFIYWWEIFDTLNISILINFDNFFCDIILWKMFNVPYLHFWIKNFIFTLFKKNFYYNAHIFWHPLEKKTKTN